MQLPAVPGPGAAAPLPSGQPDGQLPGQQGDGDPMAELGGIESHYFALRLGGEAGKPVGLIRVSSDDEAQVLTLERFTVDGDWEDDPGLIDDMHEPGCHSIDDAEAQSIQSQILGAVQ